MGILKSDSKKVGHKLIGVIVPPWTHEYMTLYTLAKGTSKSKLFKIMVEEWMAQKRIEENDKMLLQEIIDRLNEQRTKDKTCHKAIPFDRFKKIVEEELSDKGLKPVYITLILAELES